MAFYIRDSLKHDVAAGRVPASGSSITTPFRNSGSSWRPNQQQTRATVDTALHHELGDARYVADDLGDLMFGSVISTERAKEILQGLLSVGLVKVQKIVGEKKSDVLSGSTNAASALQHAYERALVHGCKRVGVDESKTPPKPKNSANHVSWSWTWVGFPRSTIKEPELIDYFNRVLDTALDLDCLSGKTLRNRFATPIDTQHAFPLSYGPDKEDMRPDFVVLPIEAFEKHMPSSPAERIRYEPKIEWFNFTTIKMPGECKTSDSNKGVAQVQRYMRGMRRAQPWQRFVTAITVTRDIVSFMRGDASGIERLKMQLQNGRASLEFVRMLLAIGLGGPELFGNSHYFSLLTQPQKTRVSLSKPPPDPPHADDPFASTPSSFNPPQTSNPQTRSSTYNLRPKKQTSYEVQRSTSARATSSAHSSRSGQKRKRNDDDDDDKEERPAAKEAAVEVDLMVQLPTTLFGIYQYEGVLFNAASVRGRGTIVLVVRVKDLPKVRVALKTSWQDVTRKPQQAEVLNILRKSRDNNDPPNERGVHILFPESVDIEEDSTLRIIRAFSGSDIQRLPVEDRVLEVQTTVLRRPVMYFWSVNDFLKGLRGALLGHAYLVEIGILHRDVSENNIVLACLPGDIRGYIMDFDMAVAYTPSSSSSEDFDRETYARAILGSLKPKEVSQTSLASPFKADRTGTTPYMSVNVLRGLGHSHFDDVESFFYVLILFFVSYKGPLPAQELMEAHHRGFTLRSGRQAHIAKWPQLFKEWSGEDITQAYNAKAGLYFSRKHSMPFFQDLADKISKRWKNQELTESIITLILGCWELFLDDQLENTSHAARARVSHRQFIHVLDEWLQQNEVPPEGFNSCPFKVPYSLQLAAVRALSVVFIHPLCSATLIIPLSKLHEVIEEVFGYILDLRECNKCLVEVLHQFIQTIGDIFVDAARSFRFAYPTYVGHLLLAEKRFKEEVEGSAGLRLFFEVRGILASVYKATRVATSGPEALPISAFRTSAEVSPCTRIDREDGNLDAYYLAEAICQNLWNEA
ncbi:hypothetical protein BU15DRAFT_65762 [Melanogaster broomeanus]|nr:hypothetical protein BU15DRAFT_65762 [Melanogaster broomeanus]